MSTAVLLDIHVPCKVLGNLRTTTTLVCLCSLTEWLCYLDVKYRY